MYVFSFSVVSSFSLSPVSCILAAMYFQCSDLMLVESIPKEPLSFHVIPFSNPRMQYTVQVSFPVQTGNC